MLNKMRIIIYLLIAQLHVLTFATSEINNGHRLNYNYRFHYSPNEIYIEFHNLENLELFYNQFIQNQLGTIHRCSDQKPYYIIFEIPNLINNNEKMDLLNQFITAPYKLIFF